MVPSQMGSSLACESQRPPRLPVPKTHSDCHSDLVVRSVGIGGSLEVATACMVSGEKQAAERRRLAELQTRPLDEEAKQQIQRRRSASETRYRTALQESERRVAAVSELQARLARQRSAVENDTLVSPCAAAQCELEGTLVRRRAACNAHDAIQGHVDSQLRQDTYLTSDNASCPKVTSIRRAASVKVASDASARVPLKELQVCSAALSELETKLSHRRAACNAIEFTDARAVSPKPRVLMHASSTARDELEAKLSRRRAACNAIENHVSFADAQAISPKRAELSRLRQCLASHASSDGSLASCVTQAESEFRAVLARRRAACEEAIVSNSA